MVEHIIEPRAVVNLVDQFIDKELTDAEKYDSRTPLDDSGAWSLHRIAAQIYAMGYADGDMSAAEQARAAYRRSREASTTPTNGDDHG